MLKKWYWGMTKGQKTFVWGVSIFAIIVAFIGIPTTLLLIYLQLGGRPE